MASEEERKRIMEEYMANVDNAPEEDDIEALGDDDEDGEEDGGWEEGDDDDGPAPPTVLMGELNAEAFEGKEYLVYSGKWAFDMNAPEADWSKFKMKCALESKPDMAPKEPVTHKLSGYFIMVSEGQKSKVLEDAEITLTPIPGKEGKRWTAVGTGTNQFGDFKLEGEYRIKGSKCHCEKTYLVAPKVGGGNGDDDDYDEDFDENDKADADELKALDEEANMSIEELRKRAYGGGGGDDSTQPSKKAKADDDEDEEF